MRQSLNKNEIYSRNFPNPHLRINSKFPFLCKFLITLYLENTAPCTSVATEATGLLAEPAFGDYVCGQNWVRPRDPTCDLEKRSCRHYRDYHVAPRVTGVCVQALLPLHTVYPLERRDSVTVPRPPPVFLFLGHSSHGHTCISHPHVDDAHRARLLSQALRVKRPIACRANPVLGPAGASEASARNWTHSLPPLPQSSVSRLMVPISARRTSTCEPSQPSLRPASPCFLLDPLPSTNHH